MNRCKVCENFKKAALAVLILSVFPLILSGEEYELYSTSSTVPPNLIFLFDRSGSMNASQGASTRMGVLQQEFTKSNGVIDSMVEKLPGAKVSVSSFSSNFTIDKDITTIVHDPTDASCTNCVTCPNSPVCFKEVINNLHPSGSTHMAEALQGTYDYFQGGLGNGFLDTCAQNAVILMSDGQPNGSHIRSPEEQALYNYTGHIPSQWLEPAWGASCTDKDTGVEGYCNGNKIVTHTISYATIIPRLETIANEGGGSYHEASDGAELFDSILEILGEVSVKSVVTSAPPAVVPIMASEEYENILYVPSFFPKLQGHWWGSVSKVCMVEGVNGDSNCLVSSTKTMDGSYAFNVPVGNPEDLENQLKAQTDELLTLELFSGEPYSDITEAPDNGYEIGVNSKLKIKAGLREIYSIDNSEKEFNIYSTATSKYDNYMQGCDYDSGTCVKRDNPMGDVFHSSPTPLELNGKKYVIAGSNSGFLHVFKDDTGEEVRAVVPSAELMAKHGSGDFAEQPVHTFGVDSTLTRMSVNSVDWSSIPMGRGSRGYTFIKTEDLVSGGSGKKAVRWTTYCGNSIVDAMDCVSKGGIWDGGRCDSPDESTCSGSMGGTFKQVFGYAWSPVTLENDKGDPYLLAPFGYDTYFDDPGAIAGDYPGAMYHGYKVLFEETGPNIDINDIDSYGYKNSSGVTYPVVGQIYGFDWTTTKMDKDVSNPFDSGYNSFYYTDIIGDLYACFEGTTDMNCNRVFKFAGSTELSGQDTGSTTNLALLKSFGSAKPVVRGSSDDANYDREVWVYYGTGDMTNPFKIQ